MKSAAKKKTRKKKIDEEGQRPERRETNRAIFFFFFIWWGVGGVGVRWSGASGWTAGEGRATVSAGPELAQFRAGLHTRLPGIKQEPHTATQRTHAPTREKHTRTRVHAVARTHTSRTSEMETNKPREPGKERTHTHTQPERRVYSAHARTHTQRQTDSSSERELGCVPALRRGASGVCLEGLTASR